MSVERQNKKKTKSTKSTKTPLLSATPLETTTVSTNSNIDIDEEMIISALDQKELQQGIDKYFKDKKFDQEINQRDLHHLQDIISEYLNGYMLFGYNQNDERVIIQDFSSPKERDAIMEFFKMVFIRNQGEEFFESEE
jgi:hypothetical protein